MPCYTKINKLKPVPFLFVRRDTKCQINIHIGCHECCKDPFVGFVFVLSSVPPCFKEQKGSVIDIRASTSSTLSCPPPGSKLKVTCLSRSLLTSLLPFSQRHWSYVTKSDCINQSCHFCCTVIVIPVLKYPSLMCRHFAWCKHGSAHNLVNLVFSGFQCAPVA